MPTTTPISHLMKSLAISVDSGDFLDVRHFAVQERMSELFTVSVVALSEDHAIDFDAVVGLPARFTLRSQTHERSWSGICNHLQQTGVEQDGLSTYEIAIVPTLWLATQRRNYRIFQHLSELDIALKLLAEWGIQPVRKITGVYKKRKYRVQYAESDYAFLSRMLEDAGISFYFAEEDGETTLVLSDAPGMSPTRVPSLVFHDDVSMARDEYVTHVRVGQQVRPGRYTMRDHDYRLPATYKLMASAEQASVDVERRLERYHYTPGAFLFGTSKGDATLVADARGKTRSDETEAAHLARRRLEAKRSDARVCTFETSVLDLSPGVVMTMEGHPRPDLGPSRRLLIVAASHSGTFEGGWMHACEARSVDAPYRPQLKTPKPKALGVESATVVGPPGEEVHTDEFGRVQVHFHWDRESKMDDTSSCWIHVSQPWGGAGYGGVSLPRIGQEVLVQFLSGDPDRPVIVGRVYTGLQKVPYSLPANKTQSGWRSASSPGGGGYNEIMFEDKKGAELFNLQAERDLHKLVKRDEAGTVGRDRTTLVQNDEELTVGNSRTQLVQSNEREVVGLSRTRTVGLNENVEIGANQSVTVGGAQAVTVTLASAETVGLAKALTVGAAYQVTVGGAMNTTVAGVQTEEVTLFKTVSVGQKIEISCGAAKLVLEKSGKITLEGTEFAFQSSGPVGVAGTKVTVGGTEIGLSASGKAEVAGSSVQISGDPIDLN